jgi:LuxR family transcriptional regulator, maltose regulon positive regulatory protein
MELIHTKLCVPVASRDLVERPRVMDRLPDVERTRVTVVHAPAGYGKTSVLSQWHDALAQSGHTAAWVSIDASDKTAAGLLGYVMAALARADVPFETPVQKLAETELLGTTDSFLALLVNRLECLSATAFVFLDDVHLLGQEAALALFRLIETSPQSTRFVLASRAMPDLHLARARARGDLLELGIEELRFTPSESAAFLDRTTGVKVDQEQLQRLDERTEGWIAGIKLVGLALRGGKQVRDLLPSFTGSRTSVADFFAEEVLAWQSDELRDFLLKTSVLNRLCPSLCDMLTGRNDSRRMLKAVEESGLFLLHLDDERVWSRYHHLFAEFLQRRLEEERPGESQQLHRLASEWFWKTGSYVEAIEHALRGDDPERAASLLESRYHDLTYTGKYRLVGEFIARIPEEVLHRYPRVMLTAIWLMTRNLRFEESRALLQVVRSRLQELEQSGELSAEHRGNLQYLVLHREMVLAAAQDEAAKVERQCQQLIDDYPNERHPYLRATVYAQLLYARREQYKLGDLDRLQATAQGILDRSEYSFSSIALQAGIGPSLFFAGKTTAAARVLEHALADAYRFGGERSALAALPALPLSAIVYESNDLDRAEQLVEDTLPFATEFGFVDQILPGFITQARIRHARGDLEGAFASLDKAMSIAAERQLERMRLAVVAERIRLLVQQHHHEQAARCLREAGVEGGADSVLPRGDIDTRNELRAIAWVRVAQGDDRIPEALKVIKHWRSFCAARGAIHSLIHWDILLAHALFVSGDVRGAQRALRDAIAHAAPARLIRSFIDESPAIRSLLVATYDTELEVLHPTDAFAAELLEAFEHLGAKKTDAARPPAAPQPTVTEGVYGKLSAKEREILALVSSGMRNREVARKLGMTEGSVKWYMQQVYDKVGTRRRLQAVERARRFGLIA